MDLKMKVDKNFVSGNIEVLDIQGDTVTLANELRDTRLDRDWFYWAFRARGAEGRTVTFQFPHIKRVGYWGAAVSSDLISWKWTGGRKEWTAEDGTPYEAFTYTFGAEEDEVFFCYNLLYTPARFEMFCERNGLKVEPLCISNKGRSVPCVRFGKGEKKILITSRHHSCESTGTYVMEAILRSLLKEPLEGYELLCVPFVDIDGVMEGDQGKHRLPHDHWIDYPCDGDSLYNSCTALRQFIDNNDVAYLFDIHAPKHFGDINDKVHIPYNVAEETPRLDLFSKIFQSKILPCSIPFDPKNNISPDDGWNKTSMPTLPRYATVKPASRLSFCCEVPYFGEGDGSVVVTEETLRSFGEAFADALREYDKTAPRW